MQIFNNPISGQDSTRLPFTVYGKRSTVNGKPISYCTLPTLRLVSRTYPNKEISMQIAERAAGNVKVLDLSGQITFTQGDLQFKDKINSLVHQGHKNILVNLANVTHVDSAGLGELVGAYTTMTKAGGSMKLIGLTRKLRDLLAITKLLTIFDTYDSEPEALKQFN